MYSHLADVLIVLLTPKLSETQTDHTTCGHASIMPTSHAKFYEISFSVFLSKETLTEACVESKILPNHFETIERLLRLSTGTIYERWFVFFIQKKIIKILASKIIGNHKIWQNPNVLNFVA